MLCFLFEGNPKSQSADMLNRRHNEMIASNPGFLKPSIQFVYVVRGIPNSDAKFFCDRSPLNSSNRSPNVDITHP